MRDDAFESRVLRFEQAWRRHAPSAIEDVLNVPPAADVVERDRLLVELIGIDLELRWRSGGVVEPLALEVYLERFPELNSYGHWPVELVAEEYRTRSRWGDRPSHAEFSARFPKHAGPILAALCQVDVEIAEELAEVPRGPRTATPRRLETGQADRVSDVPLLAHEDFLLRRLIGAGRMGKVYEATQHSNGRAVAVKFLRKSFLHDPEAVRRFIGEARTIARLDHPKIVGTQGLGRTPAGAYFIVMDLVSGGNLAVHCGRRVVPVVEAVAWMIDACVALEHAHERGVVHCDLKPANLLLDPSGTIRVTDFGLARSLNEDSPWPAEVEGTVPFMAPEQAARCWGPIDPRTDVYGIGAVLFALLTGRPPFVGRRLPDILARVISAAPVDSPLGLRPDLPESLSDLCRRCLAKSPGARYQTIREVRQALARCVAASS